MIGPEKQAQHGQFHTELLLPRASMHIHRTAGHESLRVYQGALIPRILFENHQEIHKTDLVLTCSAQAAQSHSL